MEFGKGGIGIEMGNGWRDVGVCWRREVYWEGYWYLFGMEEIYCEEGVNWDEWCEKDVSNDFRVTLLILFK